MPSKNESVLLTNCPFCGAFLLNAEKAGSYIDMGEFLAYLVSLYGAELYKSRQRLNNLIADLYRGDERMKRVYRRAIVDDTLSQRIYELSLKPLNEREEYRNQIIAQFSEMNYYSPNFGKQIVDSFMSGIGLEILPPIVSTKAMKEDGEWEDGFGVTYSVDRWKLIKGNKSLANYIVEEGTVIICDNAFCDCRYLTDLTLPASLISIGDRAFKSCYSLMNLTLSDSLMSIGNYAFYDCDSLTSLILPNSLTSIGDEAFRVCRSLSRLTLPASVTNIGERVFPRHENFALQLESTRYFIIEDDILYTADQKKVMWCPVFKRGRVLLPDTVTSIESEAFWNCRSLTSLVLPDSLKSIGDRAFRVCDSLTSLTLPASVTSIGEEVFPRHENFTLQLESTRYFIIEDDILYTADQKKVIWCPVFKRGRVSLPDTVTSIGDGAFKNCDYLTNLVLPDSLTSIGDSAFAGCHSLTSLELPISLRSIGNGAFWNCHSLRSLTLPNTLTSIGCSAFYGCSTLGSLVLPDSLTNIESRVFAMCCSLTNLVLPDSLTSIGDDAFLQCSSLSSLTLPVSLMNISFDAFCYCSLKIIYIPRGSLDKFKRLLPNHLHNKLKEI